MKSPKRITYLMKPLMLLVFLMLCSQAHSQTSYFPTETMRQVYASIFEHVRLYYPQSLIKVSYYTEDRPDIMLSASKYLSGKRYLLIRSNAIIKAVRERRKDIYSEILYSLFAPVNDEIADPEYELWFSQTEYDMIGCTLYAYGDRESIWGPVIEFSFGFNADGNIDFMRHGTSHRN